MPLSLQSDNNFGSLVYLSMRPYSLVSSLLYSYPISLCLGLLVLSILSSRNAGRINRDLTSRRCKVVLPVLWYLQLCICLSLVSNNSAHLSSAISLLHYSKNPQHDLTSILS